MWLESECLPRIRTILVDPVWSKKLGRLYDQTFQIMKINFKSHCMNQKIKRKRVSFSFYCKVSARQCVNTKVKRKFLKVRIRVLYTVGLWASSWEYFLATFEDFEKKKYIIASALESCIISLISFFLFYFLAQIVERMSSFIY